MGRGPLGPVRSMRNMHTQRKPFHGEGSLYAKTVFREAVKVRTKAKRPLRSRKSAFFICTLQLNWAAARPVKVRFRRFY